MLSSSNTKQKKMRSNITQSSEIRPAFTSKNQRHKKILSKLGPVLLPSDSLFSSSNTSSTTTDSSNELTLQKSSVISGRDPAPSSSTYNQIQSTNLLLSDVIQSSANLVYSNVKRISSDYFFEKPIEIEKNSIYTFENTLNRTKNHATHICQGLFFICLLS
jgi:hypothetical protein